MEYNIKKGDNVVTKDGRVYRLLFASKLGTEWYLIFDRGENTKSECIITHNLEEHFNRIGKYDFTKKDNIDKLKLEFKKVTEPSDVIIVDGNGKETTKHNQMVEIYKKIIPTNEQLFNKINEIIDYINKEK